MHPFLAAPSFLASASSLPLCIRLPFEASDSFLSLTNTFRTVVIKINEYPPSASSLHAKRGTSFKNNLVSGNMLSKPKSQSVKINLKLLSIFKFSGDVVKVKVKIHMKITFNFQAMQSTWHPECFCCEMCHKVINGIFFLKVPA